MESMSESKMLFQKDLTDGFMALSQAIDEFSEDKPESRRKLLHVMKALVHTDIAPQESEMGNIPLYKLLDIDPVDIAYLGSIAQKILLAKRWSEAASAFKVLLSLAPNTQIMWFMLGLSLFNLERYKEAISSLHQAYKFDPEHFECIVLLCRAYVLDNSKADAKKLLSNAIEMAVNNNNLELAAILRDQQSAILA